jgi:ubiquitin
MRKDTVLPRQKDMMESLTPEQRQSIYQKAKQVEKSAQQIQQAKQAQIKKQNQALASSQMFGADVDNIVPGISNKQVKTLNQEKQEQATQQKKLVKRTAQGNVKKAITTEYGTFDYEASPEESKILELGGQEANDLLVKIANYYRDEFKKQNVPIKESRKGFADFWEAGLNPESVDVQGKLRTNLEETFAPYTPLLPRLAFEKVSDILGNKSQELLQSENLAAKGAGLVASIGAGAAKDLSNPLAAFAYDTGNLYDPTATAEERGGAAFNVVTKYALPVMVPLGAAQAGIKAFKAGETVEQALSTASRALLRSSLGAVGKKIDTALYSKVPLNKLLDVLEAEGQMMGKTRVALSKELANAGKKYAKETGKAVDEFYTKYLNDYAEGKAQLTSPGRVPPPTIESLQSVETPTANPVIDEALRTADEIVNQAPTTGNSAIDEAFKVEQEIAEQATPKLIDETIVKTEPVIFPTEITESDLEKLFQETIAPTLVPAKATKTTKTRKVETEVTEPAPVINQESNAIVNEVSAQPESVAVQESIATPEPVVSKPITNTTPEELANSNVSVTQVPFKLDWTSKESAERSMDYLNSLRNKFRESGESGIENIDDLPLLSVSYLHQWHINNFKSSPINNKALLPKSVYQKSIEELTYGEFKNMDWRLVPDTKENQPLINLLKQREKAFNKMITYIKENPKGGVSNAWDNYRQILASRNNVVNPNDTELMDALWQAFKTDDVIDANVELNRLFGTWYDPKENKLFPPPKRTGSRSPNREAVEQFVDAQEEALQRLAKESKNKSLGNNRQRGAYVPPTKAELEFVARSVAYVIGKTGLKLDDALIETSKYLKQKFNFDVTFNSEYIEDIKKELEKINIPTGVVPTSQAIKVPVSSAMQAEQPPVPPTQTATTAIPEAGNVPIEVGISNKANLSAQELELISQAPQGKGRSASKVVEDVIQRNSADEELNILAGKVANGEALNAEQTAMLLVGQGRFNLKVFNAREALDNAIKSGASAQDIDQLRDAWLLAQADATNFAKQIQRGKSGWSDVGRVLQQKTDLFTGELSQIKANIIAEAELRKGRKLTDAEQENYKTMIDKLIGENKKLEEELAKLKATRNEATQEGRVRRTQTNANLDKLIAKKENTIRVNKATVTQKLNNEIPVATSTKIGQVITNMKLLNLFSRLTDVQSNAIKLLDNIATTPINMAVDQATSRILKSEPLYSSSYLASDRAKNLVTNAWEKMKADAKIVMAGGDVETIEKFGGNAGLGSKAAGLTDVPFKAVYHEDGKFIAADVKARELLKEELGAGNFGKKDIEARRAEILNNIEEHPDVIMNAEEYALNETFNNQNWASKINKALKGTVFKSPTAQLTYDELIGRFAKVITNVAIDVADRTGLGVARGVYNIADAIKSGKNLTVAERMAINKMITKGMVGMPLMYLGIKNWDKIEGEIRGVQQKYIDYGDLGKLGGPIAIFLHGASIGRAMNELPEDKVNDFVIASSLKLPLNTPFVSNVAEISDVLDNPAPKAIAKLLAKKASNTLIPAMIREIAMRMDTEKGFQTGMEPEREKYPKGSGAFDIVKGEFQSKIPGLRQQLPLKNQKVGRPDE